MYFPRRHEGRGWGNMLGRFIKPLLRTAIRSTKPLAKKIAKDLANQGIQAATSTIGDLASGVPPKDALRNNARAGWQRAKSTLQAGAKRAVENSVEAGVKSIKRRRKMQRGKGKPQRRHIAKKKRKSRKKTYKGIFQ